MFNKKAIVFLKNTLGQEGFEELQKFELYKPQTNTVVDPEEMKIGMQIVPRAVLSFLERELRPMQPGSGKNVKVPVDEQVDLQITKYANDVYGGEIRKNGKLVGKFKDRSLPGVGLHLMTSLELYSQEDIVRMGKEDFVRNSIDEAKIQSIIDERLRLNDIVSKMVDKKMAERDAMEELVKLKLTKLLIVNNEEEKTKKPLKLREFLEKKKKKTYDIRISKSETVNCDVCGHLLLSPTGFSGCICLGEDMDKKINLKKTEQGINISFSKDWDPENVEMLLSILKENVSKKK